MDDLAGTRLGSYILGEKPCSLRKDTDFNKKGAKSLVTRKGPVIAIFYEAWEGYWEQDDDGGIKCAGPVAMTRSTLPPFIIVLEPHDGAWGKSSLFQLRESARLVDWREYSTVQKLILTSDHDGASYRCIVMEAVSGRSDWQLLEARAELCKNNGDFEAAIALRKKGLALVRRTSGPDQQAGLARYLEKLAELYTNTDQHQAALVCLKEAVKINKQVGRRARHYCSYASWR